MCGQRCGFDMTATTAIPDAVLTGLARSLHAHASMKACTSVVYMPAHVTATTVIPDAVLTGLTRSLHGHASMNRCMIVMPISAPKRDWDVTGNYIIALKFEPQTKIAAWL